MHETFTHRARRILTDCNTCSSTTACDNAFWQALDNISGLFYSSFYALILNLWCIKKLIEVSELNFSFFSLWEGKIILNWQSKEIKRKFSR